MTARQCPQTSGTNEEISHSSSSKSHNLVVVPARDCILRPQPHACYYTFVYETVKQVLNFYYRDVDKPDKPEEIESITKTVMTFALHASSETPLFCWFESMRSTEQNYRCDTTEFYGPFAHIRETFDYSYHSNYTKNRQALQDAIVDSKLNSLVISGAHTNVREAVNEPWVIFTAGAYGSGKSYTLQRLVEKGHLQLGSFVLVDPDDIRRCFPEFPAYVSHDPATVGERTRKEAGYISEIITLAALEQGKNVVVDGSLRDCEWYRMYFNLLREEHPNAKIAILHVTAPREAILKRVAVRALETGRMVPRTTLEGAFDQVPKSVKILAPLVDYFCELNNAPGMDDAELLTEGQTWHTFENQWRKCCT